MCRRRGRARTSLSSDRERHKAQTRVRTIASDRVRLLALTEATADATGAHDQPLNLVLLFSFAINLLLCPSCVQLFHQLKEKLLIISSRFIEAVVGALKQQTRLGGRILIELWMNFSPTGLPTSLHCRPGGPFVPARFRIPRRRLPADSCSLRTESRCNGRRRQGHRHVL